MPLDTYGALQQSQSYDVMGKYSNLGNQLRTSARRRGISRSWFVPEALSGLAAGEQKELADVQQGLTDKLLNYRLQSEQNDLMKSMLASQKKQQKKSWLGTALGIGANLLGGVLGGVF